LPVWSRLLIQTEILSLRALSEQYLFSLWKY
jgi:hypothetical protein